MVIESKERPQDPGKVALKEQVCHAIIVICTPYLHMYGDCLLRFMLLRQAVLKSRVVLPDGPVLPPVIDLIYFQSGGQSISVMRSTAVHPHLRSPTHAVANEAREDSKAQGEGRFTGRQCTQGQVQARA